MNLQIFSFAYNFLISPPIFELLHLSMVLTYRIVTPHFGNLRGRISSHIMIEITIFMMECHKQFEKFSVMPIIFALQPAI